MAAGKSFTALLPAFERARSLAIDLRSIEGSAAGRQAAANFAAPAENGTVGLRQRRILAAQRRERS